MPRWSWRLAASGSGDVQQEAAQRNVPAGWDFRFVRPDNATTHAIHRADLAHFLFCASL